MLLKHHFTVDLPVDEAWTIFTDLERIAPCLPGAELTEVEGDIYHGRMRVKVGPISAQYAGTARFQESDVVNHRAVIAATGRDSKGQGTAAATITADLADEGGHTAVDIEIDLAITGKVAQFGRGVLGDVSEQLVEVFVQRLEASLMNPQAAAGTRSAGADVTTAAPPTADDELNLNYVVFLPMLKRALPTVLAVILTAVVVRWVSSRPPRRLENQDHG